MSHELPFGGREEHERAEFEKVGKFAELFAMINAKELGIEHRNAYEEAVAIAKELVTTKSKASWSGQAFESATAREYPALSRHFIAALRRCVESYNPPVNVPDSPLWE